MPFIRKTSDTRARRQADAVDLAALQDKGSNGQPLTKQQQRAVENMRAVRGHLVGEDVPLSGE